jgi:hypothetical protein
LAQLQAQLEKLGTGRSSIEWPDLDPAMAGFGG